MKKGIKILLMCMAVALPMLVLPFMSKAESKDVKIFVSALPENGSDEKHLMCGSSLIFAVDINSSEIDKENANIDWNVTKKDGTPMQAVYEVRNDSKSLEVYAPYGYSEELEVSVCINGNEAFTDIYTFETQENEEMVGKTYFQFDTGKMEDTITCNAFTEAWNASEQTYTITIPGATSNDEYVHFLGWKSLEGNYYVEGDTLTVTRESAFVYMSVWYEILDEPIAVTKEPTYTDTPSVTTGPAISEVPTETPQVSDVPSIIPELTLEPVADATPVATPELEVTPTPEITLEPTRTATPEITTEPEQSVTPVASKEPKLTQTPVETNAPEVTKTPEITGTPEVTNAPVVTEAPKNTTEATAKPEMEKIKTVSKVTVRKAASRKLTVSWSKVSSVKGYRIVYSTSKNFKGNSTKYKTTTATKVSLTKLTKNKTYYVKVCAYKVVDGKRVYGTYSNVKKITLK